MAHKRSLQVTQSGPSSVNRFIIPAVHTGEDAAVLLPKTLQETKQTAQTQILQQRDSGGGPGHKNTPPTKSSIGDTGFSDVGTGYRDDFAIQAGLTSKGTHKAKAISDEDALTASMVDASQVTGWDALGVTSLGGIAATAVKLGVGDYARNKAIDVIDTRRSKPPQERRGRPPVSKQTLQESQPLRVEKEATQQATIAERNVFAEKNRKARDRANIGSNAPGGGRGQSPTGGDVSGTPF